MKPQLTENQIIQVMNEAIMVGPLCEVEQRIAKAANEIYIEHNLIARHYCKVLAEIAIGVLKYAPDTIWFNQTQTIVEKVFEELALDFPIEGEPIESLQEFIAFKPKIEKGKENERKPGTALDGDGKTDHAIDPS